MPSDVSPDDARAKELLNQGLALAKRGELAAALDAFRRVVLEYPRAPIADNALLNKGMIHERQREDDKARLAYETLLERYPESDAAMFARDQIEGLRQKADPAIAIFLEAQRQALEGDTDGAIATYQRLLSSHPASGLLDDAYVALGMIYRNRGDQEKARECFRILRESFPGSDSARLLGEG